MCITKLKQLLHHPQSFRHITQNVMRMNPHHSLLFDSIQKEKYGYLHPNSWIGSKYCGEASFVTKKLLQNNEYNNIKVVSNDRSRHSDHCFLMINDIIIDPTYKQFLLDDRMSANCEYRRYLFNLPPFFIGTTTMLEATLVQLYNKNKETYKIHPFDIDILLKYWDIKKELR